MRTQIFLCSLLALCSTSATRADDWLQFRHDASRSGVSKDKLKFPLKESWAWKETAKGGHTPLYHAVVRKGKIYFTASDVRDHRHLICADTKTGKVIWRRQLNADSLKFFPSEVAAVSLSADGRVYVYDWWNFQLWTEEHEYLSRISTGNSRFITGPDGALDVVTPRGARYDYTPFRGKNLSNHVSWNSSVVRMLDAETGTEKMRLMLSAIATDGNLPRLSLLENPGDPRPKPPELPRFLEIADVPEYFGFPLISNNTFVATTNNDWFVQWTPHSHTTTQRMHHPLPNVDLEVSPTASMGGYPPTQSSKGIVMGEDATHRFFGLIGLDPLDTWHWDSNYSLGVALSAGEIVVVGYGGEAATRGIVASDVKNGQLLWMYPAKPPPPENQDSKSYASSKTVLEYGVHDRSETQKVQVNGQIYDAKKPAPFLKQYPVEIRRPESAKPWAHQRNPGVVAVGSLIVGEADGEIVALKQETGEPIWHFPLEKNHGVRSLVATPEHIVACVTAFPGQTRTAVWEDDPRIKKHYLIALTLKDGKEVWRQSVPKAGNLIIADNRLYFMNGTLHAFETADTVSETDDKDSNVTDSKDAPEGDGKPH